MLSVVALNPGCWVCKIKMSSFYYDLNKPEKKIKIIIFNHTTFRNRKVKSRPYQIGVRLEEFFKENFAEHVEIDHFKDLNRVDLMNELEKGKSVNFTKYCNT